MSIAQLYTQLSSLPNELQKKVAEYISFLSDQSSKRSRQEGRVAGLAKGMIRMKDTFDDPMEDFQEYQ
jgi:hypothetical protein